MTELRTRAPTLLSTIVPSGVATAEIFGERQVPLLLPEEAAIVGNAVDKRRREFSLGRAVARRALNTLGHSAVPILTGSNREPIWPTGVVGSITHCAGYCAAAVAKTHQHVSIGIDAERHEPLPDDVRNLIASKDEIEWINKQTDGEFCWDRLLFSAKESMYKTWFPLTRGWLDFTDAYVEFNKQSETFCVEIVEERISKACLPFKRFEGRYLVHLGLVITAVALSPVLPGDRV